MTRLDQNRAASQLARKAGVAVASVKKMTIWGNHSDTQYPDYKNAEIAGVPATSVIPDATWFTETFIPTVAKRGGAVIKARGASSAASAANAIIDSVRSLHVPTPPGDWFSAAVVSDGSYGIPAGLIYSYPLVSRGDGTWSIVPDVPIDERPGSGSTPRPPSSFPNETRSRTAGAGGVMRLVRISNSGVSVVQSAWLNAPVLTLLSFLIARAAQRVRRRRGRWGQGR